jgi:hypothetical protein
MPHRALVFLSCGQRPGEKEIAQQIQQMIETDLRPMTCYNAESRQGFDDVMSITEHLARADYYIFIDFRRDDAVPVSVFTHQEFALAHAWHITEMLAFKEVGLPSYGMLGYVLAHPTEFVRETLVAQVRDEIAKRGWNANYSRNLLADRIEFPQQTWAYGDHQAQRNVERICRVIIENRRSDQAALDAIAILDSVSSNGSITRPDRTYLKWAGQQAYQKTIFPQDFGEIDAFAVRVNECGVFLHSANDLYPRRPIVTDPGSYDLKYLLYAQGFPATHFTVTLDYHGVEGSTASLRTNEGFFP